MLHKLCKYGQDSLGSDHLLTALWQSSEVSEVGGGKRSVAESPTGNPSPAPIAIAPHASHARHDRSMARSISVARAKLGGLHYSPPSSRNGAPSRGRVVVVFSFILARNYNGFVVDMFSLRSRHVIKIRCSWISLSVSFILARNYKGFVQDTYSPCSRHVVKIRVSWISSLS